MTAIKGTFSIFAPLPLVFLLLASPHLALADRIPVRYRVNQKQTECIYEKFEEKDFVTFSAFVIETLMNGKPVATMTYEGPIAGNEDILRKGYEKAEKHIPEMETDISLGKELRNGASIHWPVIKDADHLVRYDQRIGVLKRELKIDWTHAGESEDAVAAREEVKKKEREAYKTYAAKSEEEREKGLPLRTVTQEKIEAYQETRSIKAGGWYRMCISSEYHPLIVEMDMRSGNELGGVDRETGHVFTHNKRALLDEEARIDNASSLEASEEELQKMEALSAELQKQLENQVKEQDLHATKSMMKHLNLMVGEMKKFQQEMHYRIKSHEASARRNHENLAWSSKVETLLYVIITGVQVYTVHKWLLSNTLLGK